MTGEDLSRELRNWARVQHEKSPKDAKAKVELFQHGHSILPVVFMQLPKDFRAPLNESTPCTIVVDIVSVLNLTEIFGCVVPMLWDHDEARWQTIFLSLFPIANQIEVEKGSHAQSEQSRKILRSFGRKETLSGLVVFDENGNVLLARLLPVEQGQKERLEEIYEVIDFLSDYDLTHDAHKLRAAEEAYRAIFCYTLNSPVSGFFPSARSPLLSIAYIRSLCVDHCRLIDRGSLASREKSETETSYDLFISYCHLDVGATQRIAIWLKRLWPDIRLFVSDPDDVKRAEQDANYFFKEARRSKALLYIATPNSVGRPVVSQEIGTNAHKPIVTVVLGDLTMANLQDYFATNPFLHLSREWIVELDGKAGWRHCAHLLAQVIGKGEALWTSPPVVTVRSYDMRSREAAKQAFGVDDWERVKSRRSEQTEEEAEGVVDNYLNILATKGQILVPALKTPGARSKLILLLETLNEPRTYLPILDLVPALVDDMLVHQLQKRAALKRINQEEAAVVQLERIVSIVRASIQLWDQRLSKSI